MVSLLAGLKFTRHQVIAMRRRLDKERNGFITTDDLLQLLGVGMAQ